MLVDMQGEIVLGRSLRLLVRDQLMPRFTEAELRDMSPDQLRRLAIGVFGGVGFVDTVEQAVLNGLIQDPSWAGYATLWLGLSSTTPTEAGGNVTEPSGGAYARVSTAAADWGAASGAAPATKSNTATLAFPQATADWVAAANLTHFTMHDASTAGSLVAFGALTVAKPVLNGDTASFAAAAIVLKLGDPGDTY